MTRFAASIFLLVALVAALTTSRSAQAAESYDNCTGFITSLPTVISTQGVWCLKQDLSTAMTSGVAITIATNNVTIDCNDFKLGGLAAGLGTQALGMYALNRQNATVRHCNIRGFYYGIILTGSSSGGHVVENNRFDGITYSGINVQGDGSVIERNRLFDTGGSTVASNALAISTANSVDVLENTISGATATSGSNGSAYGIYTLNNTEGRIIGNGIRGLVAAGFGGAYGIFNQSSDRVTVRNNDVVSAAITDVYGILCATSNGRAQGNIIGGFTVGISGCANDGNVVVP